MWRSISATMGAQCTLISVVGQDDAGQIIRDKLAENGIDHHLITIEDAHNNAKNGIYQRWSAIAEN